MDGWMDGYTDTHTHIFLLQYNTQIFLQSPEMLSHSVHNQAFL